MCAFFLRNGSKTLHHLCKNPSVEPLNFKNHIVHRQLQHSKVYSRLPQSFYRKNKELVDLSNPSFLAFFSGISASASKVGFVGWYLEKLNSRPILTKSITCGLILTAADFSSQVLYSQQSIKKLNKKKDSLFQWMFLVLVWHNASVLVYFIYRF